MRKHTTILIVIIALGIVAFMVYFAGAGGGQGSKEAQGHLNAAISHAK